MTYINKYTPFVPTATSPCTSSGTRMLAVKDTVVHHQGVSAWGNVGLNASIKLAEPREHGHPEPHNEAFVLQPTFQLAQVGGPVGRLGRSIEELLGHVQRGEPDRSVSGPGDASAVDGEGGRRVGQCEGICV